MPFYSVSRQEEACGEHLVHARGCTRYPNEVDAQVLGWHVYCSTAIEAARGFFKHVSGCDACSWPCSIECARAPRR